jgi:hypothetical protein
MSDSYSIQDVGGEELARHYPDRGLIPDVPWHNAILTVAKHSRRFWGLFGKSERFIAVVSANADGLRILVASNKFVVFIPWSEVSVKAERSSPATVARLHTTAEPSVSLELHVDDAAADSLFDGVIQPLPQRNPPCRLRWPKRGAVMALLVITIAVGVVLGLSHISGTALVVATTVAALGIVLAWYACFPLIEDKSKSS